MEKGYIILEKIPQEKDNELVRGSYFISVT